MGEKAGIFTKNGLTNTPFDGLWNWSTWRSKDYREGGTFMYKSKQLAESSMTYTVHCVMMLNTFKINSVQTCATFCLLNSLLFSFQFLSNFKLLQQCKPKKLFKLFGLCTLRIQNAIHIHNICIENLQAPQAWAWFELPTFLLWGICTYHCTTVAPKNQPQQINKTASYFLVPVYVLTLHWPRRSLIQSETVSYFQMFGL